MSSAQTAMASATYPDNAIECKMLKLMSRSCAYCAPVIRHPDLLQLQQHTMVSCLAQGSIVTLPNHQL